MDNIKKKSYCSDEYTLFLSELDWTGKQALLLEKGTAEIEAIHVRAGNGSRDRID